MLPTVTYRGVVLSRGQQVKHKYISIPKRVRGALSSWDEALAAVEARPPKMVQWEMAKIASALGLEGVVHCRHVH